MILSEQSKNCLMAVCYAARDIDVDEAEEDMETKLRLFLESISTDNGLPHDDYIVQFNIGRVKVLLQPSHLTYEAQAAIKFSIFDHKNLNMLGEFRGNSLGLLSTVYNMCIMLDEMDPFSNLYYKAVYV